VARVLLKWVLRIAVVATAAVMARRAWRPGPGTDPVGGFLPSIGGDTWPPVPTNPDRPT
jgi:hypothetical protein